MIDQFEFEGVKTGFFYSYDELETVDRVFNAEKDFEAAVAGCRDASGMLSSGQVKAIAAASLALVKEILGPEIVGQCLREDPPRFTRINELKNAMLAYIYKRMVVEGAAGLKP